MIAIYAMTLSRFPGNKVERQRQGRNRMLRTVLPRYGGDPEAVYITAQGKPQVAGLHFNLSHSEDVLVCALGDGPVGCDVQKIRPCRMHRMLSPEERRFLEEIPEPQRDWAYTRFWTVKESYLKMTGEGLAGLHRLTLVPEGVGLTLLEAGEPVQGRFREYELPGYCLTVWGRGEDFSGEIQWIQRDKEQEI